MGFILDTIQKLTEPYVNGNTIICNREEFDKLDDGMKKKYFSYHEAAHAYYAVKYNMEIRKISIIKVGTRYSYIDIPNPDNMNSDFNRLNPGFRNTAWITMNFSGFISGLIFTNILFKEAAIRDFLKVIIEYDFSPKTSARIFRKIFKELKLDCPQKKINKLSETLLKQNVLAGDKVYKIMDI
jgi:hypothetical protein